MSLQGVSPCPGKVGARGRAQDTGGLGRILFKEKQLWGQLVTGEPHCPAELQHQPGQKLYSGHTGSALGRAGGPWCGAHPKHPPGDTGTTTGIPGQDGAVPARCSRLGECQGWHRGAGDPCAPAGVEGGGGRSPRRTWGGVAGLCGVLRAGVGFAHPGHPLLRKRCCAGTKEASPKATADSRGRGAPVPPGRAAS